MPKLTKVCKLCCDNVATFDFMSLTTKCNHKVCRACINQHINQYLNTKGTTKIECFEIGCKALMEYQDMKRVASRDLVERYEHLSFREAIRQIPDFRWCKNPRCGSGQEHFEKENSPIMICVACEKMTCYTHDVPWHEGRTCEQYEIEKGTIEGATRDAIERETKCCPKCGFRIYKYGERVFLTLSYP
ncbi:17746_t:CDS:2 [Cetraspora pellucida]|uniref:RBR-type E3 ubiquitin transferase n=1 Tax=Cetraspora pellucida TaxID=1433469 RepID=A0A9N9FB96_9GLOM|nr:17746_t:CDS:2 [Cetraspora pellucida]